MVNECFTTFTTASIFVFAFVLIAIFLLLLKVFNGFDMRERRKDLLGKYLMPVKKEGSRSIVWLLLLVFFSILVLGGALVFYILC